MEHLRAKRIYAGFLSFTCAEIFAGSSPLWITSIWSLIVTIPLYSAHFFFFATIAFRYKKTSLRHLYLFGVLLGLYETWVTKVIWSGYGHEGKFVFGASFFGFGIHETLVLTLFWHPILAFILPLLVLKQMTKQERDHQLDSLDQLLVTSGPSRFFWGSILLFGTITLAGNSGDPFIVLATALPNLILLYLGKRYLFGRENSEEEATCDISELLELTPKGFRWTTVYLTLLYLFGIFFLFPERIPGALTLALTIVIYIMIIGIISRLQSCDKTIPEVAQIPWLRNFMGLILAAALLSLLPITPILFIIVIILEVPVSVITAFLILNKKF